MPYKTERYVHEDVEDYKDFDPRSIRTIKRGRYRIRIECPKGKWSPSKQKCKVGTRAVSVLKPRKKSSNPELVVVYNPLKRKGSSMKKKRRARNPKVKVRAKIGGRNRGYRQYVKYFCKHKKGGIKAAARSWRKARKAVTKGKKVLCRIKHKRRNPRKRARNKRGCKLSTWQKMVKKYGVKGAAKRRRAGKRAARKRKKR